MKNSQINQKKWLVKIYETMMIGGKSTQTFLNYKSHISRFLKYYPENTDELILREERMEFLLLYLLLNMIQREVLILL